MGTGTPASYKLGISVFDSSLADPIVQQLEAAMSAGYLLLVREAMAAPLQSVGYAPEYHVHFAIGVDCVVGLL